MLQSIGPKCQRGTILHYPIFEVGWSSAKLLVPPPPPKVPLRKRRVLGGGWGGGGGLAASMSSKNGKSRRWCVLKAPYIIMKRLAASLLAFAKIVLHLASLKALESLTMRGVSMLSETSVWVNAPHRVEVENLPFICLSKGYLHVYLRR